MSENPYDPINRILRVARTLAGLLRRIEAEVVWLRENRAAASEAASREQIQKFDEEHREWQSRTSLFHRNSDDRKRLIDLALDGFQKKGMIDPETREKIDSYLLRNPLGYLEDALYAIIAPKPLQPSEIDSEIERWGKYIHGIVHAHSPDPGAEPETPSHKNPTLHTEFERREAALPQLAEADSLDARLDEFNEAARAWPPTASEDYEPFENLRLDFANADMDAAVEFIEMVASTAEQAKEALKSRTKGDLLPKTHESSSIEAALALQEAVPLPSPATLANIRATWPQLNNDAIERLRKRLDYAVKNNGRLGSWLYDAAREKVKAYDAELVRTEVTRELNTPEN